LEAVLDQRQKCFAVRLAMQRPATVRPLNSQPVNLRGDIVEALGPQEESIARVQHAAFETNKIVQVRVGLFRDEVEILASTLGIESIFGRNRLKQGGFASAIFSDEESDRWMKFQPFQMPDCRNAKRVFLKTRNIIPFESDRLQECLFDYGRHRMIEPEQKWMLRLQMSKSRHANAAILEHLDEAAAAAAFCFLFY
jgi:hypothetical protein